MSKKFISKRLREMYESTENALKYTRHSKKRDRLLKTKRTFDDIYEKNRDFYEKEFE